jgi:uncharacterized protein (TIGR02145 family)
MKKLYFFLLLPLWMGNLSSAYTQSVKLIGADFATSAVTFTVDVGAAPRIWVFVGYTTDPSPTSAIMSRATFTPPVSAGTLAAENRGFWLENNATVTATLSGVSGSRFSWCAYAVDAPPNAVSQPDGSYQLHGTPPFTINGDITEYSNTFGPGTCIESITDFTYNPAGHIIPLYSVSVGAINDADVATLVGHAPATNPTNATAASGGDGNIIYEWRRTGTSSKTLTNSTFSDYDISDDPTNYDTPGTYYFTRYAKDNTCKTTFTLSGGQYELRVYDVPPYSGTLTWTVGTQIWSSALSHSVTGCNVTTNFGSTNPPAVAYYRSEGLYDGSGYLYNWKCVDEQRSALCPSPWRVPTVSDYTTLDTYFTSMTGYGTVGTAAWVANTYLNLWGVVYGGYMNGSTLSEGGTAAVYWTTTANTAQVSRCVRHRATGVRELPCQGHMYTGMQVRCVW